MQVDHAIQVAAQLEHGVEGCAWGTVRGNPSMMKPVAASGSPEPVARSCGR